MYQILRYCSRGGLTMLKSKTKILALVVMMVSTMCMLTGCQNKEEKIKEEILEYMEQQYSEEFEIVDFNYNRAYGHYEAGVQTNKIKDGRAAEVTYEKRGMYDDYYASLYCIGVTEDFEDALILPGEKYVYSGFIISMVGPQDKKNSYEEYKEYMNVDNAITVINLYYASDDEKSETVKQAVANALEALDNPNCNVNVHFVLEDDIPNIKQYVTTHYRCYDTDNQLKYYDCAFQVKKRDGVVTLP